ncbi:hypothetical protein A2U01_0099631, partial [Trifolium medium]|nr:hypothetical protein [Trifolium medium]
QTWYQGGICCTNGMAYGKAIYLEEVRRPDIDSSGTSGDGDQDMN